MSEFFKVVNIEGFNGLVFEAEQSTADSIMKLVNIHNPHQIIGDRIFKIPVPADTIFISVLTKNENGDVVTNPHFVATDDPQKEFTTKNPFGEHLFEGGYRKGTLEVVYSRYTNGISVAILEIMDKQNMRTIYTQNFFDKAEEALSKIEDVLRGNVDPEDLVFVLKSLETEDKKNG